MKRQLRVVCRRAGEKGLPSKIILFSSSVQFPTSSQPRLFQLFLSVSSELFFESPLVCTMMSLFLSLFRFDALFLFVLLPMSFSIAT